MVNATEQRELAEALAELAANVAQLTAAVDRLEASLAKANGRAGWPHLETKT